MNSVGEQNTMLGSALALWMAISVAVDAGSGPIPAPPRPLDSRLIFELIAAEPEIVTPTGLAIDHRGRILVVESHTHFRPEGYKGPAARPDSRVRGSQPRWQTGVRGYLLRRDPDDDEPGSRPRRLGFRRDAKRAVPLGRPRRRWSGRRHERGEASHTDRPAGHEGRLSPQRSVRLRV